MEQVDIKIGPLAFDPRDYDAEADVLYLHRGQPQEGEGEEMPKGHCESGTRPARVASSV